MSATELVAEKVRTLSEEDAKTVLELINHITEGRAPTARELMRLPLAERNRILAAQAESAERLYRENPDLIVEDFDPPMDYEQSDAR